MLVAALGTACGGGGTNKDVHPRATEPRRVVASRPATTTTRGAWTTTTVLRARSALFDGVPPPPVLDRGTDHVAITRSLLAYGRWLEWHHPDPSLVTRAYAPGGELADRVARKVTRLLREGKRIVEVDRAPYEFVVVSEKPDLVSYRVVEHLARRELVDLHGRVLAHDNARDEHYLIVVMQITADSPWRLIVVERQGLPIEVQL